MLTLLYKFNLVKIFISLLNIIIVSYNLVFKLNKTEVLWTNHFTKVKVWADRND